jgi:hypothetical protein
LLLSLLRGGSILPATLPACGNRARRCTRSCVIANDRAQLRRAPHTNARASGGARRRPRRLYSLLWWWWLRGIEPRLLDRPRLAGRLVAFLLLRRLPLGGVIKSTIGSSRRSLTGAVSLICIFFIGEFQHES